MKQSTLIWMIFFAQTGLAQPAFPAGDAQNQHLAQRPKIALVLSGGGALGYAHIGVLKVLKELHVPVDCVVGTSMGALVGGAYAAGVSPSRMERVVSETDIASLFNDQPERSEIAQRLKSDYGPLFDLTLGFNNGEISLPSGASAGYRFELFLKELIGMEASIDNLNFDDLPTPYRAIATDLETGDMKVFDHGELTRVMRASMSLPGIVSPTEIDGQAYIDGGVSANLPVETGRELCGDILIAVNLGTKPKPREEIHNSIDVALQSITLLMEQNIRNSIRSLRPQDILIEPKLGGFSSSSFSDREQIIKRGMEAALNNKERLSELALSPEEYEKWLAQRQDRVTHPFKITEITAQTNGVVNADTILQDVTTKPGDGFDTKMLDRDIVAIYGRGDFSYIGYSLIPEGDNASVIIKADSKPWGPGYLKLGFGAATDFSSPTQLNAAASYRRTWLNSLGGEWRTDVQIGYDSFLRTEYTQPLQIRDGAFISPYISIRRHFIEYYIGDLHLGHYKVMRRQAGLTLGLTGTAGELSIGPFMNKIDSQPDFGLANLLIPEQKEEQTGVELNGIHDKLDRPEFPRSGYRVRVNAISAQQKLLTPQDFTRVLAGVTGVTSFEKNTLSAHFELGDELSGADTLPDADAFNLGGPNRLSGLYLNQLTGSRYRLVSIRYYRKYATLPPQLGTGLYFGLSLESGRINDKLMKSPWSRVDAGSLFWAADTILGNVYIGYGYTASLDQSTWYLTVGPNF